MESKYGYSIHTGCLRLCYVTSYMMKSERAMGELLKQVVKETRGDDIRTQLRKLGTTFLNHREVSAQETVFRLLSMPLKGKAEQLFS